MSRTTRLVAALVVALSLFGATIGPATASPAGDLAGDLADAADRPVGSSTGEGRVLARTPWTHLDPIGDTVNPSGNLRRVVIENGRRQMRFTFNLVGAPVWDNLATDRTTGMVFDMDWGNTTPTPNRTLVVTKFNNQWRAGIFNGNGGMVCSRTGGVTVLANFGFRIGAPVVQCLGGAHFLRVGGGFVEDQDPGPADDTIVDRFPNATAYGPFIALPSRSRSGGGADATTVGGWIVH